MVRSLDISCTCSELHQLLQLATLLDEHSTAVSSLDLSFELWHNTQVAELLSSLIAQHGSKLAGLGIDFRACAADLSGGLRAGSIEAAAAAEEMLAEALQQAGADAAQGLQLRSFSSTTRSGGPLLQQLPAASLSSLQLLALDIAEDEAAELQPVAAALRRLTGLQSLRITTCYGAVDSCLPALSSLHHLTSLQLDCLRQQQLLRHLPSSLQQLALNYVPWDDEDEALEMSFDMLHLSELCSLNLQAEYHHLTIAAGSRLPASLTALTAPNVGYSSAGSAADGSSSSSSSSSSSCVLLGLTRLQHLSLEECSLTADAIAEASNALTGLTQVQLAYTAAACSAFGVGSDELVEAAAAWALLPLVSLSFGLQCSSNHGKDAFCCEGFDSASAVMLEQLAQLTNLTSLRTFAFAAPDEESDSSADGDMQSQLPAYDAAALAACLRQLPLLQSLHVVGRLVGGQQAVTELQEAVQGLSSCGLPKQ
ncbi:hypothetical protein OEZ86_005993 [Tetradesmus obliquus]|nr:hypothetical protein OEZ86_005993 [Tetradesmus obliquus]